MASGSVVEGWPGTEGAPGWPGMQCVPGQPGTQPLPKNLIEIKSQNNKE